MCLKQLPLESMIQYVWNAVYEEDNNGDRANNILKQEGFTTFQDIIEEFKIKFDDKFIKDQIIEENETLRSYDRKKEQK